MSYTMRIKQVHQVLCSLEMQYLKEIVHRSQVKVSKKSEHEIYRSLETIEYQFSLL